jgi:hypothetical protein
MTTDKFFVQLNLDFADVAINDDALTFTHGYDDTSEEKQYGTINFFNIDPAIKQRVIDQLPQELQSWIRNVRVAVIQGRKIMPHIDHRGAVSVNYHLVSGDAKTTFWSAKVNSTPFRADGEYTDNVYNYEDVVEECSYVAENHSCYLLNTGRIHDIQMASANSVRKLLQLTFAPDMTYEPVLNKLQQLNLVKQGQ